MAADLEAQVPAWFVCRRLGITKQTFNYWVSSGKLSPVASQRGTPLYRYGDVLEVERETRNSPNSRRGTKQRLRSPAPVGAAA